MQTTIADNEYSTWAKTEAGAKHMQAFFKVMKDSNLLLALPPASLKTLLLAQDNVNAAEIISREMDIHYDGDDDDGGSGYSRRYAPVQDYQIPETFYNDVSMLRCFPGGALRAVGFPTKTFVHRSWESFSLLTTQNYRTSSNKCDFTVNCQKLDASLLDTLLVDINDHVRSKLVWDPEFRITDAILHERTSEQIAILNGSPIDRAGHASKLYREDVFPGSSYLLAQWHSSQFGKMIALKVAGYLLPLELVDMVEECFYSKIFLDSLGI